MDNTFHMQTIDPKEFRKELLKDVPMSPIKLFVFNCKRWFYSHKISFPYRWLRARFFDLMDWFRVVMYREYCLYKFVHERRLKCNMFEYIWMFFVLKYFYKWSSFIRRMSDNTQL